MAKPVKYNLQEGFYFVSGPLEAGTVVAVPDKPKETLAEKIERLKDEERLASAEQEIDLKKKARIMDLRKEIRELQGEKDALQDPKGTGAIVVVKHFDIVNGQLERNDDGGAYTLDEALKVMRSEPKAAGVDSTMLAIINALKPGDQVKFTDLLDRLDTLAERMTGGDHGVAPDKLDLVLENRELKLRQEFKGQLDGFLEKFAEKLKPKGSEDEGSPFTVGEGGQITIASGARLNMNQVLAYQMTRDRPRGGGGISDRDGNIIPMESIDGVLRIKTWEREQSREDDKLQIQKDAIKLVREHAPDVLDAVRNLGGPGGKTKEVMEKSGWGKHQSGGAEGEGTVKHEQVPPPPDLVPVNCARCHTPHKVSPNSKMFKCSNPECKVNNWLGTKEELKEQIKIWEPILGSEESSEGSQKDLPKEKSEGPSSPT